jgi:hypothetical protein
MTAQDKQTRNNKKQRKINEFRLLTLKQEFLKLSVNIQTAFAVETLLAEGYWLKEQVNMLKLRIFQYKPEDRLFRGQRVKI